MSLQVPGYLDPLKIHEGRRYIVLRVREERSGAPRILKTVQPGPLAARAAAALRHEHRLLSGLDVPGVVKPLALQEVEGTPALVLEDAGPIDLEKHLGQKPLELDRFLELALQLISILRQLHRRNVLHLDINPSNLVLGPDGKRVTLIDFGTATKTAGFVGEAEGTLAYIAPEQTGRMNRLVDHRADLYSCGATLYELLTGVPPFISADPAEIIHAQLARPPLPPHQLNASIPRLLSDIVLKLLSKMPEKRYQSAEGLEADLREASRQWRHSGTITPFALGWHDLSRELVISDKLYGRDAELSELGSAVKRVRSGPSELMLVSGEAGSGKSSLVQELRGRFEQGAWFLFGKCDPLHGHVPHASLREALRGLVQGLLREPPSVHLIWRKRLREALGTRVARMARIVPELEYLLGEKPSSSRLGPAETEHYFQLTLQCFIQAFATAERPLVLFMDDLQWADVGSLHLLCGLATTRELRHVLLLGAFRSNEVGPLHPLTRTLEAMRVMGVPLRTLEVPPLELRDLTRLCSDSLHVRPRRAEPLAELLLHKTAGNPFFVKQLLRFLHHSGLLSFDSEQGRWSWDPARLSQVQVTENVVEVLLPAIRRLPVLTQRLLQIASCLRHRVDLWLLAAVAELSIEDTAGALWSALQQGILVPDSRGPRFKRGMSQPGDDGPMYSAAYCFAHDRIQQALYSLLSDEEKRHLHRRIGRQLLEGVSEHERDERIFDVADHFDMGMESHERLEPSERLQLAELYLQAGSKAEATSAFSSALVYLRHGLALLPSEAWQSRHELALALHQQAAECAHLTGDHALAEAIIQAALPQVTSDLERVGLYEVHVLAYSIMHNYEEALRWGKEGLRLMGEAPPESEPELQRAIAEESTAVSGLLRGRTREALLAAPSTQDARLITLMRLMSSTVMAAYFEDKLRLFAFIQTRMLHLSLEHGHTRHSSHAYLAYAFTLGADTGDYDTGMMLGEIGVELSRRSGDLVQECRCLTTFAGSVNFWRAPYHTNLPLLRRAMAAGLEGNEFLFASYATTQIVENLFAMGTELPRVHAECEASLASVQRVGHQDMADLLFGYRQAILCLQDRTDQRARYDDEAFSEKAFLHSIRDSPLVACEYRILRLQTSYLLGDIADALEMSRAVEVNFQLVKPLLPAIDYTFYTALALAAYHPVAPVSEKDTVRARLEKHLHVLETWARGCPENFRQKHLLVAAEFARIEGRQLDAMRLYDSAIDSARQNEFRQDEALAHDRAGRFYYTLGHRRIAVPYLRAAMKGFARWGATAKAVLLEEEFPDIALSEALPWKIPTTREQSIASGTGLDLLGILKASETLSSEVVLDRLLEKLMTVCLEVAGAQRGALLLHEGGTLSVRAVGSVSEPVSLEHTPFHASPHVPPSLVTHAYDSGEALVLADARKSPFRLDPYVVAHNLKSALVVPIRRQASSVGVLYLENNLATRAFPPNRVQVLKLLSSQMAIALENSLLFERLQVEVEERRRAERAVRFLAESSMALAESLDYETILSRVARLAVPFLADCCTVLVPDEHQNSHVAAIACANPTREEALRELQENHPPTGDSRRLEEVTLRTGQPQFLPDLSEERLQALGLEAEHVEHLRPLGIQSTMAVPLLAQDQRIGALSFLSGAPERRYGPADLALAQELARRAALSLDHARLYREAQEAIRLRDEFLSIAAHELYTPLTSLQLSMQGLQRTSPSPEDLSRVSRTAQRQIRRLTRLVDELLSVARLQQASMHLHIEDVDLLAIARDVIEHFSEESARSGTPLRLHSEGSVIGHWDRLRLEQVVTNLLGNALKFGGGKPIEVTVSGDEGMALLTVQDHGIGIPEDKLHRIFGRFERAVSSREYGGLGLGLYIVHEIVAALGGAIHVDSTPGVGTCFTVSLPRAGPAASREKPASVMEHA
ncbi:sensor histidine kinase [Hyalangium versicolor]|uniref:sensor histidine kinase n=1 Tax=Hyalangium versicolor TaxID=2861190 RepID=UPI001CCE334B|nr:ATP-binding sensor histidine kinase [Hyalangium versicolor]